MAVQVSSGRCDEDGGGGKGVGKRVGKGGDKGFGGGGGPANVQKLVRERF